MQETLLKIRCFERGLSKSLKKVNFTFSFEPSPFECTKLSKTKGAWQLRRQILDITTQNRDKIKETKIWISGGLETINSSIEMLDTGFKGLTSLQMQTKAKTKTGNSNDLNTNTKTMTTQTQYESSSSASPPPPSSPPSPPKSSPVPSQRNTSPNPKDMDILNKGKGNLYVIMDSNRKFINFKELLAGEFDNKLTPIVIPCGNIRKAESILTSNQINKPHIILLHIGINDLGDQRPEDIALDLKDLAKSFQNKFNCEFFVSGLTPKGNHYQNHVHKVNNRLKQQLSTQPTCIMIGICQAIRNKENQYHGYNY